MSADSPIDSSACRLLELFRVELSEVHFPDVDREVLEALAGEVTSQHERVTTLRAELASAEEQLAMAQSALLERAREGLSYARLYAARHPELSERLDAIDLAPRTRRGRKARKPRATKAPASGSGEGNVETSPQRRPRRVSTEPAAPLEATG